MKTVGDSDRTDRTGPGPSRTLVYRAGVLVAAATLLTGCSAEATPEPTPHATSAQDAAERQSACLRDRGWTVTITDDGAISSSSVSEEQLDVYRKDIEECGEGLLPDRAKFTDEQWAEMYAAIIETADCLGKQGYDAPDRPSLQAFIDMNGDWSPYSNIDTYDFERLENLCPQAEFWG
jgi:hypothetical protein